jgi:hypothetical protein
MKMSRELFDKLSAALAPSLIGKQGRNDVRTRWDALWASDINVNELYRAGLNDAHIDTALRKILNSYGHFTE